MSDDLTREQPFELKSVPTTTTGTRPQPQREKCSGLWVHDRTTRRHGRTCGNNARYMVSFCGVSMPACGYHRKLIVKQLQMKLIRAEVFELYPGKRSEVTHGSSST